MSRLTPQIQRTELTPSMDRWLVVMVLVLVGLGFLVYCNTLQSSFHWDDYAVIVNNPAIRDWTNVWGIWEAFNTRVWVGWTFAVNYALGGLDVGGYHFFNIWLHVCNAVWVFALIHCGNALMTKNPHRHPYGPITTASVVSVIFLVHPLATQAVNYIWQRSTLMSAFFCLGSIVLYLHNLQTRKKWAYGGSLVACVLAMGCKENAFVLPGVIIGLELIFSNQWRQLIRTRWLAWFPFLVCLLIIPLQLQRQDNALLDLMRPHSWTQGVSIDQMPPRDYWLTQVNVIATYLRMLALPYGLNVDHDYPLAAESGVGYWIFSFGGIVLCCVIGVLAYPRQRWVTAGIFFFIATIALESIVTSRDLLVEHRMYLPMIGLLIAVGTVGVDYGIRFSWRVMLVVVLAIVGIFGWMSFHRNQVWSDEFSLWNDSVLKSPQKARPLNNRARMFRQVGQLSLALNDLNRAVALDPNFAAAYLNRGHIYKATNELSSALNDYSRVITINPNDFEAFAGRASVFKRMGQLDAALKDYTQAIRWNPNNPEYFSNRAYIYEQLQQTALAMQDYKTAIGLDPQYVYALNNRGNLWGRLKDYDQAVKDYTQCLRINPQFGEAYLNRAVAHFYQGQWQKSKEDLDQARRLGVRLPPEFVRQLKSALADKNN